MRELVGYLVTEGSMSPTGDFASNTTSGYCTLWKVFETTDETTGEVTEFDYEVELLNIEKKDFDTEYKGLEVREDTWWSRE